MQLIKRLIVSFLTSVFRILNWIGNSAVSNKVTSILRYAKWKSQLEYLGEDVVFHSGVVIHNCEKVSIKKGTCIAEYVHMWGGGGIEIGENVLIASHAVITSLTHEAKAPLYKSSLISEKVYIEDNVWIGTHAVILPGIRVRKNAIIGAGAVVTKDVSANDIVVGVPARSIRTERELLVINDRGRFENVKELSEGCNAQYEVNINCRFA